jgi:hypothetical protein
MGLVLLMAIVPLVKLDAPGPVVGLVVGLAMVAFALCGLLRRAWAWYATLVVPAALLVAGWWVGALAVLGVLFALLWGYVLHVRRNVTGATPTG